MRDRDYIDTLIDFDTEPVPVWLEDRLRQWHREIVNEPLPARFTRLLRRFNDEDARR